MSDNATTILFVAWGIWMLCIVTGFVIGQRKDQGVPGLVWSFCLGPLGLIVAICLPDRSDKVRDELTPRQLEALRRQLQREEEAVARVSAATARRPAPAQGPAELLRVARDGTDLGEFEAAAIRDMIQAGQLTLHDFYFDPETSQWAELGRHPRFSPGA